jgi:hypothetical protein
MSLFPKIWNSQLAAVAAFSVCICSADTQVQRGLYSCMQMSDKYPSSGASDKDVYENAQKTYKISG